MELNLLTAFPPPRKLKIPNLSPALTTTTPRSSGLPNPPFLSMGNQATASPDYATAPFASCSTHSAPTMRRRRWRSISRSKRKNTSRWDGTEEGSEPPCRACTVKVTLSLTYHVLLAGLPRRRYCRPFLNRHRHHRDKTAAKYCPGPFFGHSKDEGRNGGGESACKGRRTAQKAARRAKHSIPVGQERSGANRREKIHAEEA